MTLAGAARVGDYNLSPHRAADPRTVAVDVLHNALHEQDMLFAG